MLATPIRASHQTSYNRAHQIQLSLATIRWALPSCQDGIAASLLLCSKKIWEGCRNKTSSETRKVNPVKGVLQSATPFSITATRKD